MGESICLMQPFSYISDIPNEAKEGNPINALGQTVSFGRFISESLSWEKWSTFPHRKYVEEAERHSRPGSVAEKKAFFEAHYKQIAERKAAAAALLEQAQNNASKNIPESESEDRVNSVMASEYNEGNKVEAADFLNQNKVLVEKNVNVESTKQICNYNNKFEALSNLGEDDRTTQMGKPQSKNLDFKKDENFSISKKKPTLSSSKSSSSGKATKLPSSPTRPTILSHSKKENNSTPMNKKSAMDLAEKKRLTPISTHKASVCRAAKHPLATPWSENRRNKLQSPNASTSFRSRIEERAAKGQEKLEETFNANQAQKIQHRATLQGKAETELRKLRQSLCFKARPLPNFYKERAASKDEMKKVPTTQPP
ncbi:protein WVD2-like 7 [Mangifera indica]|uniref:protein WVD2-like 7 n=1 Tax=Mangifera indica TaxID=29780 RepID=UPI001CFB7B56|nr:protein WVD2-like 7 [Mangifera indica]